jgi:hypothetical protein
MAISSIFSCEANRWNIAKFVLGVVCALSLARAGLAGAVLLDLATFPNAFPRITEKPLAYLVFNAAWVVVSAVLFAWVELRRRKSTLPKVSQG